MTKFTYHDLNVDPLVYTYDAATQMYRYPPTDKWYFMERAFFDASVEAGHYKVVHD